MRTALTVFFAVHALSAALALGLPLVIAWAARRRPTIARGMTSVALVNLSVTVVMGVAALLFISRAYPRDFTGAVVGLFPAAISVLPLLSTAYAALYAYQLKEWKPGPGFAGGAILGIAIIFASLAAWSHNPGVSVRIAHFVPASFAAAGVAVMVRFAGQEECRFGARLAFAGSLLQGCTGVWYVFSIPELPHGMILWAPIGGAAGLVLLLGAFSFAPRITPFAARAAAAGLFFVVLAMSSLREGSRSIPAARPGLTSKGHRMAERLPGYPGMENFAALNVAVYRSAQPRPEAWPILRQMGMKTVIGLRSHHTDAAEARREGIEFVDLALRAGATGSSAPPEEEIRAFFDVVLDPKRQPVLFHCAQGKDRTGTMAALYRIEVDRWTAEEAIEEMRAFGYHGIYKELIDFVRGYVPRGYGKPRK